MDPYLVNVLTLAYQGDAVYELLVRRALIQQAALPAGQMHRLAMNYVSAARQSMACDVLIPLLNKEETSIFMRARNANPAHAPRHADIGDYHRATALEAVFGYLDLNGQQGRIGELFDPVFKYLSQQENR